MATPKLRRGSGRRRQDENLRTLNRLLIGLVLLILALYSGLRPDEIVSFLKHLRN